MKLYNLINEIVIRWLIHERVMDTRLHGTTKRLDERQRQRRYTIIKNNYALLLIICFVMKKIKMTKKIIYNIIAFRILTTELITFCVTD